MLRWKENKLPKRLAYEIYFTQYTIREYKMSACYFIHIPIYIQQKLQFFKCVMLFIYKAYTDHCLTDGANRQMA